MKEVLKLCSYILILLWHQFFWISRITEVHGCVHARGNGTVRADEIIGMNGPCSWMHVRQSLVQGIRCQNEL